MYIRNSTCISHFLQRASCLHTFRFNKRMNLAPKGKSLTYSYKKGSQPSSPSASLSSHLRATTAPESSTQSAEPVPQSQSPYPPHPRFSYIKHSNHILSSHLASPYPCTPQPTPSAPVPAIPSTYSTTPGFSPLCPRGITHKALS